MEPEIRYVRTDDRVTLAYYTKGEGIPFVVIDLPYSHLTAEGPDAYGEIAASAKLVRYDPRGFGLSQRDVVDFSLDAMVRDLEAVVDRLELRRFILLASRGPTTPIALRYAAAHPERLLRMILYGGFERLSGIFAPTGALLRTEGADWRFVSENISRLVQGWEDADSSRELAALLRESVSFEGFRCYHDQAEQWDASDTLEQVTTPTLVIAIKDHPIFGPERSAEVVARMRDCRMFVNEGRTSAERDTATSAGIRAFLGVASEREDAADVRGALSSGTAVILFVDIAESTALTERMGDAAFREKARALDGDMRAAVREHGGSVIDAKTLGDGILATFAGDRRRSRRRWRARRPGRRRRLPAARRPARGRCDPRGGQRLRRGGEHRGADQRAVGAGRGAGVGEVRELARTSAGVVFEDRGELALKGVGEAVRVYAVRAREAG